MGEIVIEKFLPTVKTAHNVSFGQNVRRFRLQKGWQSQELARRLGVQRSVVSAWENDRKGHPETPTLFKLAKALEVTIDELLEGVDSDYEVGRDWRTVELMLTVTGDTNRIVDAVNRAIEDGKIAARDAITMLDLTISQLQTLVNRLSGRIDEDDDYVLHRVDGEPLNETTIRLALQIDDLSPEDRGVVQKLVTSLSSHTSDDEAVAQPALEPEPAAPAKGAGRHARPERRRRRG